MTFFYWGIGCTIIKVTMTWGKPYFSKCNLLNEIMTWGKPYFSKYNLLNEIMTWGICFLRCSLKSKTMIRQVILSK